MLGFSARKKTGFRRFRSNIGNSSGQEHLKLEAILEIVLAKNIQLDAILETVLAKNVRLEAILEKVLANNVTLDLEKKKKPTLSRNTQRQYYVEGQ